MRRYFAVTLWAYLIFPQAGHAAGVSVSVTPDGPNQHRIVLNTTLRASQNAVWKLLTDYNHHADILPYMSLSRVIRANPLTVQQVGSIRVLFWNFKMEVAQEITEIPPREMRFHAVAGDFQRLEGVWRLSPAGQDTALSCDFHVQPKRRVPRWAVRFAARRYLAKMMKSFVEHATAIKGFPGSARD